MLIQYYIIVIYCMHVAKLRIVTTYSMPDLPNKMNFRTLGELKDEILLIQSYVCI